MSLLENYNNQYSFQPSPFAPAEFCQHSRSLGFTPLIVALESPCLLFPRKNVEEKAQLFPESLSLCNLGGQ
jgi:hypothetical protein